MDRIDAIDQFLDALAVARNDHDTIKAADRFAIETRSPGTTRFAWIDVMGSPFVAISARVVYGDGPEDGHVLVDAATRDAMAAAVLAAQLHDESDEWARDILAMPAAPEPWTDLYDATDYGGGFDRWQEMILDPEYQDA